MFQVQVELGGDGFVGGFAKFGLEGEEAIVVVPEFALLLGGPGCAGGGFGLVVDVGEGEMFVDEGEVGILGDRVFNNRRGFGAVGAFEVGEFDEDNVCGFGALAGGVAEEGCWVAEGLAEELFLAVGLLLLLLGLFGLLLLLNFLDGFDDDFGVLTNDF